MAHNPQVLLQHRARDSNITVSIEKKKRVNKLGVTSLTSKIIVISGHKLKVVMYCQRSLMFQTLQTMHSETTGRSNDLALCIKVHNVGDASTIKYDL